MAALLVEICSEVQLSDFERAFILCFVGVWFIATPLSFLSALIRRNCGKKGGMDGTDL